MIDLLIPTVAQGLLWALMALGVYVTFRVMDDTEMAKLLNAVSSYVVSVSFRDPKTNTTKTIQSYTGTPEPEYYTIQSNKVLYKSFNLNFIEL